MEQQVLSQIKPRKNVVLFGRPGSGKSSLASRLASAYGFRLIQTGELLRQAVKDRTPLGLEVDGYLRSGDLVPDHYVLSILETALSTVEDHSLLFDGFPRTASQIPLLQEYQAKYKFVVTAYVDVAISPETAIARMSGRRVCSLCGFNYHLLTNPPKHPGVCDLDGAPLERRRDDSLSVIEQRQALYDVHTNPILDYYQRHEPSRCLILDGEQTSDSVFEQASRRLEMIDWDGAV